MSYDSFLWVALVSLAALVVFLTITFLKRDTSSANEHGSLRFLTAPCGGFASGFFSGYAFFRMEQQLSNGAKVLISGTAAFALFLWSGSPMDLGAPRPRQSV